MDYKKALDRAKVRVMSNHRSSMGFMGHLMLGLKHKWEEDAEKCPTAQTNGTTIWYNPEYLMSKEPWFHEFLIAHETWHVGLMHPVRLAGRDEQIFQYACDFVVNQILKESGMRIPPNTECLQNDKYSGWTTDEVYDDLLKNAKKGKKPQGSGSNCTGQDLTQKKDDGADGDGASQQKKVKAIQQAINKAMTSHKMDSKQGGNNAGTGSPELDRMIDSLNNPKLPWTTILRRFMTAYRKDDYSTRRFNRRFLPDFYLPTLYNEAMPNISIYNDTSCSVTDDDFRKFLSECQAIKEMLKPKEMCIYTWDTHLYPPKVLRPGDQVVGVPMMGGGGTNIRETLENIISTKPEISIIFTDGFYQTYPDLEEEAGKATNLFYIIFDNDSWTNDHGEVIYFDLDDKGYF